MSSPESICILRLSALGDVCNAVAAVQAIQKSFSEAKITWIIGKLEHQLVYDLPGIEFIVFEKARGKAAIDDLKTAMQNRSFDVLLHMQVAMRANRLARLIPAKKKLGYDWKRAKEGHSLVINERIPPLLPKSSEQHVLDSFISFALKLGAKEEHCYPPTWNIPVSEADREFALSMIPDGQQTMILCPAASKKERCWSSQGYIDAIHFVQ
ncbi:glycosyltransferase family 9 protein, partial [Oleiphilus sp. HI0079]